MPRLFVAIDLPEQVKDALGRMRPDLPGARWLSPEQLHLTLAFLGEQEAALLDGLKMALAMIREDRFSLAVSEFGTFPDQSQPRVLWVGVDPVRQLVRLAGRIREEMAGCGVTLENRPFRPHITIARLRPPPAGRNAAVRFNSLRMPDLPALPVREFVLYESRITSNGAIYTVVERFPLLETG